MKSGGKMSLRPFKSQPPKGPAVPVSIHELSESHPFYPASDEMLCALSGQYCIYQLLKGHKFTTDDVFTSAMAVLYSKHFPDPSELEYMDMGCGLGAVLLMTTWALNPKSIVGIEAQKVHYRLCSKSLVFNDLNSKVQLFNHDLRSIDSLPLQLHSFDLITGTPPYFPLENGPLPDISARAKCAFEIRGGIEVYFEAASKYLSKKPSSRFIVCQTWLEIKRTEKAADSTGFQILERWDIFGKLGKRNPLFCVFACAWKDPQVSEKCIVTTMGVRDEKGRYTRKTIEIMQLLGKPIPSDYDPDDVE